MRQVGGRRRRRRRQRENKRARGLVGVVPELKGHGGTARLKRKKKHRTCTPTGFRQTGFSQSAMETADTPHDARMTKARKVYFSANRAQVWPQTAAIKSVLRTSRAPRKNRFDIPRPYIDCQYDFQYQQPRNFMCASPQHSIDTTEKSYGTIFLFFSVKKISISVVTILDFRL